MLAKTILLLSAALAPLASALPHTISQGAYPSKTNKTAADGNRLTIYWGAEDDSTTLDEVCADSSYDIVTLAFLAYFFSDGGYPKLSLGNLDGPSQAQSDAGATGLQDASSLVSAVQACQDAGKLVILSLGGSNDYADVKLSDDGAGEQIADTLWNLFLGGTDNAELRPFGELKLDGLDLDNESGDSTGYSAMVQKLRGHFSEDTSKTYYLTAAPQCPFPDQSIPLDVCSQLDFVWVQFYNNGDCNVAQSGFIDAVKNWSEGIGQAKLFIGAISSDVDGDEGYVDSDTLVDAIGQVKDLGLSNFGGAMLWEAQLAKNNGEYQKPVKAAL